MSIRSDEIINLSNESIDSVSQSNEKFLSEGHVSRAEIIKLKLTMENALFVWQQRFGQSKEVSVSRVRLLGKSFITYTCEDEYCNPLVLRESDEWSSWIRSFASTLVKHPKFEYLKGVNSVVFFGEKQKLKMVVSLMISILAGIIIGLAGLWLVPESVRIDISSIVLKPVYSTYLNVCGMFGIPLIFLSVMMGIVGVGNINTFSTLGSKMIKNFFWFVIALTILGIALGIKSFSPYITNTSGGLVYSDLVNLLLGAFPNGIFQPFIDCRALQLVLMGVGFGIAVLYLDEINEPFCRLMANTQEIFLLIIQWITSLIPFFITVGFVDNIWKSSFISLIAVLKSLIVTFSFQTAIIAYMLVYISIKYKVGIGIVLKKVMKTFLIATATNSCAASIPENYNCCASQLGIDEKVFSFGIPIGTTIFKPATIVRLIILCFYMITINNMNISISWLVVLFIMVIVVSVAVPAIPGGVIMLCGVLFTNLGIPTESITEMLTTDVFFDCFCTGINQIAVSLMLTIFAGKVNLLDLETLRK